jgi:putative ABC transport system permease protein
VRRSLASRIRSLGGYVAGIINRRRMDARLEEEIALHLEMESERNIRQGMSPSEARRAAAIRFGGREWWREASRDEYRSRLLDDLAQDLRYAGRTLRAAPAFTAAAILTLSLGIGATTAIFSAIDGAMLKPLPFRDADRVIALFQTDRAKGTSRDDVAPGNFVDWRARTAAFSHMAAAEPYSLVIATPEGRERVGNWNVTRDFFSILEVKPALGRLLESSDFLPRGPLVVVLTHGSWQRRFGADARIVGKRLMVGETPATIVGVLPRNFAYLTSEARYEMFAPKVLDSTETRLRSSGWYHAVASLAPGVTIQQASADINRVAAGLANEFTKTNTDVRVSVAPLHEAMIGNVTHVLRLLAGAVAIVLLVACVNVANLMLARTARRGREFVLRTALGAGRGRMVRQVLTEALVIALGGGAAGVALAYWGAAVIRRMSPAGFPRVDEMRVDARALTFALAVVLLTTIACGLVPALRAAPRTNRLATGARIAGGRQERRARHAFLVAEVALAVMLSIGAGLLVRSFYSLIRVDRGYRTDHVLSASLFVWQYPNSENRRQFVEQLVERAARLPGVTAAGTTSSLPLAGAIGADQGAVTIVGRPTPAGQAPSAHVAVVTPSAFSVLGIRFISGRAFTRADDATRPPVAVVTEAMARRYWPNESPIGKRLSLSFYGPPLEREVIGIVADVRQQALEAPPEAVVYLPYAQMPIGSISVVLRTELAPRRLLPDLRHVVAELDPRLALTYVTTFDEVVAESLRTRRFTLVLVGCFSVVALVLAVIGVYGVMSNGMSERTRELGVRIALGAQRRDIIKLGLGQGLGAAGAGIIAGVVGGAGLGASLRTMLFGVGPFDPSTIAVVAGSVLVTAALACYVPARRATTIDPLATLRAD